MALPKKYDFNDYDNYLTDPNPTTSAEAQDYFQNMDMLVTAMVDTFLWQPGTNYANGDVVKSNSMPNGTEAVCVSTNGGKSSNVEPQWGNVGGGNVVDGTCFWKLRWGHWSKDVATSTEAKEGTVDDKIMTPKGVDTRLNKDRKWKTYDSIWDITQLDINITFKEIFNKLTGGSFARFFVDARMVNLDIPATNAYYLNCYKQESTLIMYLERYEKNIVYFGRYSGSTFSGWTEFATTDIVPVGTIIAYAGSKTPTGFLDCSGASLSPTTYSNLFNVIGTTYGGNGTTTFNLPNLNNNSFLEGSDTVGTVKSAGLPNITGRVSHFAGQNIFGSASGAFYLGDVVTGSQSAGTSDGAKTARGDFKMDASRSSGVYGNSTTVQPKSVTVKYCIKY